MYYNGKKIIGMIQRVPSKEVYDNLANPNLLINGDFRVNQRGQSSYTNSGYTIDRWKLENDYGTVTVLEKGIRLSSSGSSTFLVQRIEDSKYLVNKQCTLSICLADGTIYSATGILKEQQESYCYINLPNNGVCRVYYYPNGYFAPTIQVSNGYSLDVLWVKLEFGPVATANHLRLYAEELALCQYYLRPLYTSSVMWFARNNTSMRTQFTILMRTKPTLILKNPISVFDIVSNTAKSQSESSLIINTALTNNQSIFLSGEKFTDLTTGQIYQSNTNELIAFLDAEI